MYTKLHYTIQVHTNMFVLIILTYDPIHKYSDRIFGLVACLSVDISSLVHHCHRFD